ncbi:hypothetical protein HNY73_021494 [Argiope bruennichi]|uniref:Uncharacterized protein n=1 Tax=Argiope bruennichi TaxID=94029 RepID=A0A8T0E1X4_ARGBR|nr:hypothetical protein HNY73_021494 [Argiope bruennichi]
MRMPFAYNITRKEKKQAVKRPSGDKITMQSWMEANYVVKILSLSHECCNPMSRKKNYVRVVRRQDRFSRTFRRAPSLTLCDLLCYVSHKYCEGGSAVRAFHLPTINRSDVSHITDMDIFCVPAGD